MTNVGLGAIIDYILSNKSFLELAFDVEEAMLGGPGLTVGGSGEGVRQLLIKAILETLREHIRNQLGADWEIKISGQTGANYPLAQWGEITIRRSNWPKLRVSANGPPVPVAVKLWNDKGNWRRVRIAFVVPRFDFPDPLRASLTTALLPLFPDPNTDDWCVAADWPGKPFDNWWEKRFLIDYGYTAHRARTDVNATSPLPEIKELGDRLVRISLAAEKAVPVEWPAPISS